MQKVSQKLVFRITRKTRKKSGFPFVTVKIFYSGREDVFIVNIDNLGKAPAPANLYVFALYT